MKKINTYKILLTLTPIFLLFLVLPNSCLAMPPGALLYRTSSGGKMYGYSGDPIVYSEKGIIKNIYSGHVGIYIGKEEGIDYVVEALSTGVVKTPADKFVNLAEGEKYLGAKIPKNLSSIQQAKVVEIAKSLVGKKLAYDYDFKTQKGPDSGEWTCVGLAEKIYESANISNPNNLASLEYDKNYYALDITPDGFDNYSVVNDYGDCFSRNFEFSKIGRRQDILIPAPEIIGYNLGLENNGERYIFLPYTQYLQPSLKSIQTDISIASSFSGSEVRGSVNSSGLALRWSLINNPISSVKFIATKVADVFVSLKDNIFGGGSEVTKVVLSDVLEEVSPETAAVIKVGATVNKALKDKVADVKTAATKNNSSSKASSSKDVASSLNKQVSAVVNKASSSSKVSVSKVDATKTDSFKTDNSKTDSLKVAATNKSTSSALNYYNPVKTVTKISTSSETASSGARTGASSSWTSSGSSTGGNSASDNYPKIATINKIYASANNDFIELYNPGEKDFDLSAASYRLEKAKTAEDPSLILRIGDTDDASYPGGTIIKAKKTYLIVSAKASQYWLSKADAIVSREEFTWPGSGYTIYLGTGALSSSHDSDILEAIGFGSDATYFQGEAPAEEIKDYYLLNRIKSTNNNKLDFNLIKSDDPSIDWVSLVIATSTDNTSSTTDEVASTTNDVASTTDEIASSSDEITTTSPNVTSSTPLILINKIYSTGNNDWLELFNFSDFDFDLASASYRLEKSKTALDPALIMRIGDEADGLYPGGTIIKSQGKYIIASSDANDFTKSQADAIATRTEFTWTGSDYSIYLGNGPISSSTDENIRDLVGFGSSASWWRGNAPALEIIDNYILNRISRSANNNLDFNLIKSLDPNINWEENNLNDNPGSSNEIYNFLSSDYNLFPLATAIESPGITHLWHFDDCRGSEAKSAFNDIALSTSNYWVPGKFICAKENAYNKGKASVSLSEKIDVNNFSISFWFKSTGQFPRLRLLMSNQTNNPIELTIEPGLMQFSGLATPEWRNYIDFPFDNTWRQVTLVINRGEGYWSFYVDGVRKHHVETYKLLGEMDYLEFGGDNSAYAVDEVAIWNRALSEEEIIDIRNINQPFSPLPTPEPQARAILKHFWNFNEGIGTSSLDLVGGVSMNLAPSNWFNINLTNSVLSSQSPQKFSLNFPEISSKDLSLTFWYRNPKIDEEGRVKISLGSEVKPNLLSLEASYFSSSYNFDNNFGHFSRGENLTIPHDLNWHLLSLVYDSYRSELNYYVDGILNKQEFYLWSTSSPVIHNLTISAENWGTEIDDLGIWQGALSASQIQRIYANN